MKMINTVINLGILMSSFVVGVLLGRAQSNNEIFGLRGRLKKEKIELDNVKQFIEKYKDNKWNPVEVDKLLALVENRLTIMRTIDKDISKFDHFDVLTRALNYRELKTLLDDFEMHSRYARIYMNIITNHGDE